MSPLLPAKWRKLLLLCLVLPFNAGAAGPDTLQLRNAPTLHDAFAKGQVNGRFRYFFMNTINKGDLKDFYANAAGGYLRYSTKPFHRLQVAIGASFTYNVLSTDFTQTDATTGAGSRYEITLFDITSPTNRFNIARLDECQLKYFLGNSIDTNAGSGSITIGKQFLNTPFMNEQDGRMHPSSFDGLWLSFRRRYWQVDAGWIWGVSPRGTPNWYSTGQSVGIYGGGANPDGSRGNYRNNVQTKGVAVLGLSYTKDDYSFRLWEYLVQNVLNIGMAEASYTKRTGKAAFTPGLMIIREDAVGSGGNADRSKVYINPGAGCWVASGRLELHDAQEISNGWTTSLNYTRIAGNSRFQMPREWGREPFYTFIPRERNEGTGDVHAVTVNAGCGLFKTKIPGRLGVLAAIGYYDMPEVNDYRNSKYGTLSYAHFHTRIQYVFAKSLSGLRAELLYGYKKKLGNDYGNLRYVINRVDMSLINLIVNYDF